MAEDRSSKGKKPTDSGPLVMVSRPEGTVVGSNRATRDALGSANGRRCWEHMGVVPGADGLPCNEGCSGRLVAAGNDHRAHVTIDGDPYELTCMPVNGKVVSVLAPGRFPAGGAEGCQPLTERENEVLRLLAEGMTSAEIAGALGVGAGTIRTHVEHLRGKLGAPTRAAVVSRAFRLGYLR